MKSATTIGIRELRDGLSRHLATVRSGAEITITDHGKPIARIVPVGGSRLEQLIAEGRVIPAAGDGSLPARLPARGSVSDLIER
ncbi:MAG: type II toxin-antitoxin system Phd/YefM family antitoxin [Acidimicrobiales bacterium]